jgi:drug/metabolite transporter (DMT)-like permease
VRRSWVLFAAMCVIWGIPYLLIRVAVRDFSPGTLVFARTALGGLVLLPFAIRSGALGAVARRWRWLLAFTIIEICVPWLLLSYAEQTLSSSLAGLLVAAVPLVGVVLATILRSADRGGGLLRLAGLVLGLVGVLLLLGLDVGQVRAGAVVEMGVVVVGYAVAPVILSRRLSDLPSIAVVCASLLLAAVGYLPYALTHLPTAMSVSVGLSVLTLALVCTALAFLVFFALIAEIGPSRATVFTYVNPAVAVVLGVTVLGEQFTAGMAAGLPLILIGSFLAARRAAAAGPAPEAAVALPSVDANLAEAGAECGSEQPAESVGRGNPRHLDALERFAGGHTEVQVDGQLVAGDLHTAQCDR